MLLYWGATWCPPCNQLKATLFNRQDFIERVARLRRRARRRRPARRAEARRALQGARLPDDDPVHARRAAEITRLPGEVDAPQVLARAAARPGRRPPGQGRAGRRAGRQAAAAPTSGACSPSIRGRPTRRNWCPRPSARRCWPTLAAAARPATAERRRGCWLKALAASDDGQGVKADAALRERVAARAGRPGGGARADGRADQRRRRDRARARRRARRRARARWSPPTTRRCSGCEADATLSRADRMARADRAHRPGAHRRAEGRAQPKLPPALLKDVREHVARADREITDGYERQAVITAAAYALGQAGLWAESDALLKANLAKSHSPYYLMSQLAGNARKRGRQGRGAALVRAGLREERRPGDAAAVGRELRQRAGRPGAAGRARASRRAAAQLFAEAGGDSRRLLRPQRALAAARRQEARGLERRRPARRRDAAPAGPARRACARKQPAERLRAARRPATALLRQAAGSDARCSARRPRAATRLLRSGLRPSSPPAPPGARPRAP